jgi:hypothetical protein
VTREHGGLLWQGKRDVDSWDDLAERVEAAWQNSLDGAVHPSGRLTTYLEEQG